MKLLPSILIKHNNYVSVHISLLKSQFEMFAKYFTSRFDKLQFLSNPLHYIRHALWISMHHFVLGFFFCCHKSLIFVQ